MAIKKENLLFHYNAMFNVSDSEHDDITETWYDLSGNGNHGKIKDGIWGNNFLILDGKTSWVNTGTYTLGNEVTIEILFQAPIVNNTDIRRLIDNEFYGGMALTIDHSAVYATGYYNGVKVIKVSNVEANQITHIAMSIKNNSLLVYKNGILQNQLIISENYVLNNRDSHCLAIGANSNSPTTVSKEYFRGKIYSARLYNVALTDSEIYTNFTTDKSIFDLSNLQSVGDVSKIRIGQEQIYDLKDIYSRNNRLSKTEDDIAFGKINFLKGIQINKANILYDEVNDIVTFI